jgi:hypothetical protein
MKDQSRNLEVFAVAGMMALMSLTWFCLGIGLGWALWG